MGLPPRVRQLLTDSARGKTVDSIDSTADFFEAGVIDSFSLVDLISVIELECGIKIPDADVIPDRFKNVAKIEQYINEHPQ
jgi:acyl carrier protein